MFNDVNDDEVRSGAGRGWGVGKHGGGGGGAVSVKVSAPLPGASSWIEWANKEVIVLGRG